MSSKNKQILYNRFTAGKKAIIPDEELLCPKCGEQITVFKIQVTRSITQYGEYMGDLSGSVYNYEVEDEELHEVSIHRIACDKCGKRITGGTYDILYDRIRNILS